MKIAIFSDLHMGIKQDSVEWHETAYRFADFMTSEVKKRGIDNIVFLGDFFHNRSTISVNTLNAANNFLKRFEGIKLHMILGNHDLYYSNDYAVSGVNLFDNFSNIKVYTTPEKVNFGSKSFMMCGWGYNPLDYTADVLITHLEIAMFKFNEAVPENVKGVKCSELLEHYKQIFSGHFHLRQCRKYDNGEIRYTGNPFQMDYSDECKEKGFEIYDTETGKVEFVANPASARFCRFKLSELIVEARQHGFEALEKKILGSYFKLIVDRDITLSDLTDLDNIIQACKPLSYSHEWENGRDYSQNVVNAYSADASEFEMRSIIMEFCEKVLDVQAGTKKEVHDYLLDILRRVEENMC